MKKRILLLILLFLITQFNLFSVAYAEIGVKVGAYEDTPVVFRDAEGKVKGIYVDILDKIAAKEKWKIEYVFGSWSQCLDRLKSGEIDLLIDIAYSEDRSNFYDFTHEYLLSNWGQAYAKKNSGVQSILDLKGKTIAGVTNDIYYLEFKKLVKDFNIECRFVETSDYTSVFRLLEKQWVDVGIVNRLYGVKHEQNYNIDKTAIIFSPVDLRVASAKGKNQDLLKAIDDNLAELKKQKNSSYYQALDKWLGNIRAYQFPRWLLWVALSVAGLLILLVLLSLLLKAQVSVRTAELSVSNEQLREEIKQHKKACDDLTVAQDQLIQAAKMQVVGGLASGVAHEVKNPLTIILQGVEYLEKKISLDDKNVSYVFNNIKSAVERADNIIRGLLDFSRVSKLEMEKADINLLCEKSLSLLKHQFDKNHIQVVREMKSGIPAIEIDKNKIEQVLINLFMNAVQAMPQGGKLLIKTYALGDKEVIVEIEDSGTGIPKDNLDKIFDPFFTTKRNQGGTGLGLSVVKSIIEMHNGKITIRNKEEGAGARVNLTFRV